VAQPLPFSEILRLLFEYRLQPDGSAYKAADVARESGVSASQISLLINGQRQSTSISSARSLLHFFKVPITILDVETREQAIAMLKALPPMGEPSIRLRGPLSQQLSPRALTQIGQLVEYVLAREAALERGLPEPPLPDLDVNSNEP